MFLLGANDLPATGNDSCLYIDEPTVIDTDGCYFLKANILAKGTDGLIIKASNVVLDLNGFSISAASGSTSSGIYAIENSNVEIKNGYIEGFLYGVRVSTNVDDSIVTILDTDITGGARGVSIKADNVRIKDSFIHDIKGHEIWSQAHSIGVEVFFQDCLIIGNFVKNVFPVSAAEAIPISLSSAPRSCTVTNNLIINDRQPRVGRSIGLWLGEIPENSDHIKISENKISGFTYGLMAHPSYYKYVYGNIFAVDCSVIGMHSMESLLLNNTYSSSGLVCRDTADYLRNKKNDGYEWRIRLAVTLFEQQRELLLPPKYCLRILEAESLLKPLVDEHILAKEQMVRLKSLKSVACQ